MPVAVYACSGILLPIASYVSIGRGKCCARGPACIGQKGSPGAVL